jgi:hypothetical protein
VKGSRRFNGLIPGLSAAALVVAVPAAQAQGQPDSGLLDRCQAAVDGGSLPGTSLPLCRDVVVSIQLLQPELGLTLAGGNPVLGTASPLGTKFRWIPRFNVGGRISFNWLNVPDVRNYPAVPSEPVGTISASVYMPQLDVSVGVFDGLDLATTLGGFAAVEVMGSLGPLVLPAGAGFQNDATGVGLGARIGILRESFSAPGISVSGFYKWFGRVQLGNVEAGDDAQLGLDMSLWSFRAGVSKSFVAVGVALTVGWDRYSSQVDYGVAGAAGELVPVVAEGDPIDYTSDRWSAFLDVSYIVLFFNIVAEAGWQQEEKLTDSRGSELSSGEFFGALGVRFTL